MLECDYDDNSQEMFAYDYEKYKKSYAEMGTTGNIMNNALYSFDLRSI